MPYTRYLHTMKLTDVIVEGRFCGLQSVEECIRNYYLHRAPYEEEEELKKLRADIENYKTGNLTLDWGEINSRVERDQKDFESWCRQNSN